MFTQTQPGIFRQLLQHRDPEAALAHCRELLPDESALWSTALDNLAPEQEEMASWLKRFHVLRPRAIQIESLVCVLREVKYTADKLQLELEALGYRRTQDIRHIDQWIESYDYRHPETLVLRIDLEPAPGNELASVWQRESRTVPRKEEILHLSVLVLCFLQIIIDIHRTAKAEHTALAKVDMIGYATRWPLEVYSPAKALPRPSAGPDDCQLRLFSTPEAMSERQFDVRI